MNNHQDNGDKKKKIKPDDRLEIVLYKKKPEKGKIFHGKDE